jgi:uncharacterized protein involved in type VI secretion and phage assembly
MSLPAPVLLFAEVVDTKDPDSLGRVQVKLIGYGAELKLPWLRLLQGYASNSFGAFLLPEKGDEVVVLCGAGSEPDGMVILGSVYNGKLKPKTPDDGKNNLKQILTRSGHLVSLNDEDGKEQIDIVASGETVFIRLVKKDGLVQVEADKDLKVKTGNSVVIETDGEITVNAAKAITVKSNDKIVVQGKDVEVKAQVKAVVEASLVEVKGKSKVEISASGACKVTANGPLELKGAVVNIG